MAYRTFIRDATGRTKINPTKLWVQWYVLSPEPIKDVNQNLQDFVTIPANGQSPPLIFKGPQEGPFEAFFIAATVTDLDLRVTFDYRMRNLQNWGIHAWTIFGGQFLAPGLGYLPFMFPVTLWLLPMETLTMQLTDLSGVDNTVRVSLHGRMYAPGKTPDSVAETARVVDLANRSSQQSTPYFFTTDNPPLVLAANARTTVMIRNDNTAAFELHKIMVHSTDVFTMDVYDPNSGRKLTNRPVHSDMITGNANMPYILPEPLFMKRNAWIQLDLVELSGAQNTIHLTLAGQKIYSGDEGLP